MQRRRLVVPAFLVVVSLLMAPVALAEPPSPLPPGVGARSLGTGRVQGAEIAAMQAEAATIQDHIVQQSLILDRVAAKAAEARAASVAATARRQAAARFAADAAASVDHATAQLRSAAVRVYVVGPGGQADDLDALKSADPYEMGRGRVYSHSAFDVAGNVLTVRRRAKETRDAAFATFEAEETGARTADAEAATAQQAVIDQQAQLQSSLAQINSQVAGVAADDRAQLASQAAQHLARPDALELIVRTPISPVMPQAAQAITIAYAQRNKPYLWGAVGPNSFDCSGLLVYSWGLTGVKLPRTSYQMYSWAVPIPLSALQPGDLVFFGETRIHHVGMYVGGGLMINAPRTGDVVKLASIWWDNLIGFGRVHGPEITPPPRAFQVPGTGTRPGDLEPARPVKPGKGYVPAEPPHPGDPLDEPPQGQSQPASTQPTSSPPMSIAPEPGTPPVPTPTRSTTTTTPVPVNDPSP